MPQQKEKKLAGGGGKNPWRERRGPARVGLGSTRRALQALSWPHACPGPSSLVLSSVVTSPGASAPCCVGVKGSSGNCWHPRLTLPPKNRVITNGMITLSRTFPPRVRKETRPRCAPSGGRAEPAGWVRLPRADLRGASHPSNLSSSGLFHSVLNDARG